MKRLLVLAETRELPVILASLAVERDYRQMFRILEREHGATVLELISLFPEARNWEELSAQFGLGWNSHLNAAAHRRWAEALAEQIDGRWAR